MYSNTLKIVSSQLKLLPSSTDAEIAPYILTHASAMKNEPFSFQVLYRAEPGVTCRPVSVNVETSGLPAEEYRVDYVPVINAANDYNERGYIGDNAGLYPDLLVPRPISPEIITKGGMNYEKDVENLLNSTESQYQALWITLNPDSETVEAGSYEINIKLISLANLQVMCEKSLSFEVIDALLPEPDAYYTNWFHVDSLCDYHKVEPYSEEFYDIFKNYIKNAVKHRMNTLLLPAFTPALDTPRGCVRRCVQLVDITRDGRGWQFDFERMRNYIRVAGECGIRVFEHCHLFSQWGAVSAPSVYDTEGQLLFGWETDAAGDEYRGFIRAYLAAFLGFAKSEGLSGDCLLFHISDEPTEKQLDSYQKAYETVSDILAEYKMIDALSDIAFWRSGLVKSPVAFIRDADAFDAECPEFWLYYTCGTYAKNCSNRLITNTAGRTRVLGLQMYRYKAAGFLHWGYNYYYDRMSEGFFDPKVNPCGYKLLPGCAYLAYPTDGGALPSLREKHMCEAFDDLRALKLLQTFIGREKVLMLCEQQIGGGIDNRLIPDGNAMFSLREEINACIKMQAGL